jgi:hypothetical protein
MSCAFTLSSFYVNLSAVILYFFLHIMFSNVTQGNVCQLDHPYPNSVNIWVFAELIGFYSSLILNIIRVLNLSDNNYKPNLIAIYCTVIAINFIAGTSSLFQYVYQWTRICSDEFEYFLIFFF